MWSGRSVTPNDTHYEIAKAFLEQDFPLVCDKPLALTVEQAEELARIAKERNLPFAVTHDRKDSAFTPSGHLPMP